jgi:hypothetical protein
MKIQKLISAGFATAALASASVPALAWTVWPDVDFEWYADVGKPMYDNTVEITPAPRAGYIWSPGHYENRGRHQAWVSGQFVKDDYDRQVMVYNTPHGTTLYATGPTVLYDSQGNVIPTSPDAYPVDSARR